MIKNSGMAEQANTRRNLTSFELQNEEAEKRRISYWPAMFVIALALPFYIDIGSLLLTVNRLFLLLIFFPALIGWMFGKAGPKRTTDYLFILFVVWVMISLIVADGFYISIEAIGMFTIETLGAYFLGRTFVRSKYQFRAMIKAYLGVLAVFLPFAFLEAYLNRAVMIDLMSKIWKTLPGVLLDREGRWGMRRAQVSLDHPILYGVFCAVGFSLSSYGLEKKKYGFFSGLRALLPLFCTFFSLSTGAYLAIGTQMLLTGWEFVTRTVKERWRILIAITVILYVSIDLLSNRTPFQVFITYMTFDQGSSYNRVLIWQFGMEQVWRTPIFGIGFTGDWERPWYMSPSMDNFWLVLAVRHGIPAFLIFATAAFLLVRDVGKATIKDPEVQNMRMGWMFSVIGVFLAICSVHLWTTAYVFVMFVLGTGMWFVDYKDEESSSAENVEAALTEQKKALNFRPATRPVGHAKRAAR